MSGSSLIPIVVPIMAFAAMAFWLGLVFYADSHPRRAPKSAAPTVVAAVPAETVPAETVPAETVPAETVPDETVPDETVPDARDSGLPVLVAAGPATDAHEHERAGAELVGAQRR